MFSLDILPNIIDWPSTHHREIDESIIPAESLGDKQILTP
jgi:hypothetical protein